VLKTATRKSPIDLDLQVGWSEQQSIEYGKEVAEETAIRGDEPRLARPPHRHHLRAGILCRSDDFSTIWLVDREGGHSTRDVADLAVHVSNRSVNPFEENMQGGPATATSCRFCHKILSGWALFEKFQKAW
jgi:hypothetical protein